MAPTFGRSISFPLSPARSSRAAAARHVRSVSLPSCRSHPLLAHLHNTTRAVRDWAAAEPASVAAGLAHIDALHAALAELLLLPEARAALRAGAAADCLLDGFLVLADAHGAFQEALLDLRRHAAEAHAALRRRDQTRLASAVRAQRHAEKDLARLASSVRAAAKLPHLATGSTANAAVVEVSAVLAEAVAAVATASAAVFSAVEALSSAATAAAASSSKKPATLISLVKKSKANASSDEEKEMAALDKLEELEECIAEMEAGSDKVFRSILHTRVALLNIHTQTCC
ncbi:hypothetical protein ACP70R_043694 [Stipagrostis hirtigluma subsp. patula]